MSRALCVTSIVMMTVIGVPGQSPPSFDGVWKVEEVLAADGSKVASPQPGLLIVKGRHFADVRVQGDKPRPSVPAATATADELRAMWGGSFVANAGTFEVGPNNQVTSRFIVAKNPNAMDPKAFTTYSYKLEGSNTMWLTNVANQNGPIKQSGTVKWVRVE